VWPVLPGAEVARVAFLLVEETAAGKHNGAIGGSAGGGVPSQRKTDSGCLRAIDFLAMADAQDKNDQAVVFDLANEPVIAYTVFPELSKPRAVQRLSDAARIV
jgi:hypothetical protein